MPPAASGSEESDTEHEEEGPAAATAPVGCELITPELVIANLGIDPGACEPIESWADGPAGLYPAVTMAIDTTASAPWHMPVEVCGGAGIDGALPVAGADYGYAVEGDMCVVKGSVGVKVSALLDPGVATAEDWQRFALAVLPLL